MNFQPENKINIKYLELVVTTKCTLRCKDCANLMPLYKKPYCVKLDVIKESMTNLLEAIDGIETFRILGGEPFLYDDLREVINFVSKENKIKKVEVVTNGTIYPKDEKIIEAMKSEKVELVISDYGGLSKNKCGLIKMKDEYGINVRVLKIDYWLDYSNIHCRNRNKIELESQYKKCNHQCTSLFNGILYECPRCAHGIDLGIVEKRERDYLDLLDNNKSVKDIQDELIKIFSGQREFISACNYCDVETDVKQIPVAIQM